jgi:hypothetical protein
MEYWSKGFWNNGMVGLEKLIDLFPLFIPSVPSFPYSIPPKADLRHSWQLSTWMSTKNPIFPNI